VSAHADLGPFHRVDGQAAWIVVVPLAAGRRRGEIGLRGLGLEHLALRPQHHVEHQVADRLVLDPVDVAEHFFVGRARPRAGLGHLLRRHRKNRLEPGLRHGLREARAVPGNSDRQNYHGNELFHRVPRFMVSPMDRRKFTGFSYFVLSFLCNKRYGRNRAPSIALRRFSDAAIGRCP
jgi:hypothetical protein